MSARRFTTWLTVGSLAPLVVYGALGCASADPLVVGHHETDVASPDGELDADDAVELDPMTGDDVPDLVGDLTSGASCESQPFRACGGSLRGTWEVVDTCNGEDRSESTLALWSERVGLSSIMCNQAARVVTSNFSGELLFDSQLTLDRRELTMRLDLRLSSECLTATLQGPNLLHPTQGACSALQSDYGVTCRSADGVCQCTTEATIENNMIGEYNVRDSRLVAIGVDQTVSEYDYCVQGEYLLYKRLGDDRYAILRRKTALDPVLTLPPR